MAKPMLRIELGLPKIYDFDKERSLRNVKMNNIDIQDGEKRK